MNTQTKDIVKIMDQISSASAELLQCLTKEHDALSLNQLEKLVPLSEQKQQLVTQLEQLDQQRQSSCGRLDFTSYLNSLDSRLSANWRAVSKSIKKCQQQNEVNGRLLNRRNSMVRETLEIVTGRKLSTHNTYDATGLHSGNASIGTSIEA